MTQLRPAAAILATLGALGIGFSAYIDWLGERAPQDVPIRLGSLVLLAAGTLALRSHGAARPDHDTSHLVPRPVT